MLVVPPFFLHRKKRIRSSRSVNVLKNASELSSLELKGSKICARTRKFTANDFPLYKSLHIFRVLINAYILNFILRKYTLVLFEMQ